MSLTTVLIFVSFSSFGQTAKERQFERMQRAEEAINNLKGGYLLIRLPSKHKKLQELERLSGSSELNEATRKKMKREWEQTKTDRDSYNNMLIAAFREHYDFSEFLFFYDTSTVAIKNNVNAKHFLDDELQPTLSYPTDGKPFLVLRSGTTDPSVTSGIEAMVVMDAQFEDLERPFPYYVKLKSLGHILEKLFAPRKRVVRSASSIAIELNEQFHRFYKEKS